MLKKEIKKIFCVFLVCIMTLAIAVPTFASENDTKPRGEVSEIHRGEVQKNGSDYSQTVTFHIERGLYEGPEEFRAALEKSELNGDAFADIKEKVAEDESKNSAIKVINTILSLTLFPGLGLVLLL